MNTYAFPTTPEEAQQLTQAALAPYRQWGEYSLNAAAKVTQRNYRMAGDWIEMGLSNAKAATQVDTPNALHQLQTCFAQSLVETLGRHSGELSGLAHELQTDFQAMMRNAELDAGTWSSFGEEPAPKRRSRKPVAKKRAARKAD